MGGRIRQQSFFSLSHRNFFFLFPGVLILDIDVFLTIRFRGTSLVMAGTPSPHQLMDHRKLCFAKNWPLADANEDRFLENFFLSLSAAANIAIGLTTRSSELSHRLSVTT